MTQANRINQDANRLQRSVALFGALATWAAQMSASYIISSHACFPHQSPLASPQWQGTQAALIVFNLLCLGAGIFASMTALRVWTSGRHGPEGNGAAGFLAMLGLLSSGLFLTAIIFTVCAALFVPICQPWFKP